MLSDIYGRRSYEKIVLYGINGSKRAMRMWNMMKEVVI
jgi:hypothetical protein